MYPLKLKPIYNKTIWANDQLTKIRGVEATGYGTSWEVSAHPYAQNEVVNGKYQGVDLLTLLAEHEKAMLGKHPLAKMLRLAFLDAKEDLSIQVHPYNEYALAHDHDLGKTESWYILAAEEGATLVAGTLCNDKEVIKAAIQNNELEQYLRKVEIKAGDFIFIDAGMLHALGGNILALEVGTNSNVTYRFYDYGRKDAQGHERELHVTKSFDVVDLNKYSEKVATPIIEGMAQHKVLVDCDEFKVVLYDIIGEQLFDTQGEDFHTISFVHHGGSIEYNEQVLNANYCDNFFIPASCGAYTVRGNCRILKSTAK